MKRILQALAITACIASPAAALADCKPVTGHFRASIVSENCAGIMCTEGRVWGGIQGQYAFAMTDIAGGGAPVPGAGESGDAMAFFFIGRSTVALKAGPPAVQGTDHGVISMNQGFASLITFDNGGGEIRLRGQIDNEAGVTSGDYVGTFCTP